MSSKASAHLGGRPVFIANFRSESAPATSPKSAAPSPTGELAVNNDFLRGEGSVFSTIADQPAPVHRGGIRYNFPTEPGATEGGVSDGYCFRMAFGGGRYENSYEMIKSFLIEQGYGNVPIPKTVEELTLFRLPQKLRHQLSLFGEDGYVHNPIKILFPAPGGRRGSLTLELHDEAAKDHLLRFHRRK